MWNIKQKLNLIVKRRTIIGWWVLTQMSRICAIIALVLFGLPALVFLLATEWYENCLNRLRNLRWQAMWEEDKEVAQ